MTTILGGDPIGDIIYITNRWIPVLAQNGALLPLDEYLTDDYYESLPGMHSNMKEIYSTYQGKAYAFSVNGYYPTNSDIGSSQGWIYNRDMYKEAGLVTPNELQEAGEWTFETARQAATKLTRDVDGDGQIDVWGVHFRIDEWPIDPEMAMYANNGGILVPGEDGKMVFGGNKEEALTAIQWIRDMVKVDKAVQIGDYYDGRAEFNRKTNAQLRLDLFAVPAHAQEVDFDYGWVFFPKGPHADDYINPVWGVDCLVLPITCKEPEAMIALGSMLFETTADYRDIDKYDESSSSSSCPSSRTAPLLRRSGRWCSRSGYGTMSHHDGRLQVCSDKGHSWGRESEVGHGCGGSDCPEPDRRSLQRVGRLPS